MKALAIIYITAIIVGLSSYGYVNAALNTVAPNPTVSGTGYVVGNNYLQQQPQENFSQPIGFNQLSNTNAEIELR